MHITDLDGKIITITDLPKAIAQAALFAGFEHAGATREQQEADAKRKAYWNDIHQQLLQLKKQSS